jgi:hypothetical protein
VLFLRFIANETCLQYNVGAAILLTFRGSLLFPFSRPMGSYLVLEMEA